MTRTTIMKIENEESDQFLVGQLHLGKEEAFGFIFRKYYKGLTVQAIRFVHDQDTAQSLSGLFCLILEKALRNIEYRSSLFISIFHGAEPVYRPFEETATASTGSYYKSDRFSGK